MATRAERFRAATERSGRKEAKKSKKTAKHVSLGRSASYALEDRSPASPPSRKSTRGSSNRQKAAAPMKGRLDVAIASPERRHFGKS
jgi:hypothetical protein